MPPIVTNPGTIRARTTTDLITHAEDIGVRVVWALGLPERGRYYPGLEVITLRHGMTERRTVSTLAHELGHAAYGDPFCTPVVRRRALRWAALFLITPAEWAEAEMIDPSTGGIALNLGVTTEVVEAWRSVHEMRG